jgi:DNA-binding SARP family transcriptional activator
MPRLDLRLLGGFDLRCDGESVDLPYSAQRPVAFLAFHERQLTRIHVAAMLWLETDEEHSLANLRASLWRVRKVSGLIEASKTHVRLGRDVTVDVRSFVDAAQRLFQNDARGEYERCDTAALHQMCLQGDLLPDWYEDWVLEERDRLQQLRLHALETLAGKLADAEDYARAVDAALAAVRTEPLRESAQRVLMKVLIAEGNQVHALIRYQAYCTRLHRELGLSPSMQIQELVASLTAASRITPIPSDLRSN